MRLLYTSGACSISPHIVLEETGAPFETQHVDIMKGETRREPFLSINPKGKTPVLVLDDGTVITENPVILQFLARAFPERGLLPADRTREYEALQICEYLSGTVHSYGIARLFVPSMFCAVEDQADAVREEGKAVMRKGFDLLASRLETGPYLLGDFSIADASLFYFELHATRLGVGMPGAVRAHFEQMLERPSVQKVIAREGLNLADFIPA